MITIYPQPVPSVSQINPVHHLRIGLQQARAHKRVLADNVHVHLTYTFQPYGTEDLEGNSNMCTSTFTDAEV